MATDCLDLLSSVDASEVDGEKVSKVNGWLAEEATDFTSRLAHLQRALRHVTGGLELGVFKGQYLGLLAAFSALVTYRWWVLTLFSKG